ncbi:MAG: septum site-determining protein MinC [Pseudomonadota bacterium]|jgi:septum site-determining protein MinC
MILTPMIKLNSAQFDYYILKINRNPDWQQILSKLADLRIFDPISKYIALEFECSLEVFKMVEYVYEVEKLTQKTGHEVKFIVANQYIYQQQLAGKVVIHLPNSLRSKNISYNRSLFIEDPVRSGISIQNDGDIIISNLVSSNAEVVSSGNIHVYGYCRGRLFAGHGGNKLARIFVNKFNAELIAIAGVYRIIEDKLPSNLHNRQVQIFLDHKDRLNVVPIVN